MPLQTKIIRVKFRQRRRLEWLSQKRIIFEPAAFSVFDGRILHTKTICSVADAMIAISTVRLDAVSEKLVSHVTRLLFIVKPSDRQILITVLFPAAGEYY